MIDSKEKRANVLGVGRPWMRDKLPGTNDEQWRIASGNAYGGNSLSGAVVTKQPYIGLIVNPSKLMTR